MMSRLSAGWELPLVQMPELTLCPPFVTITSSFILLSSFFFFFYTTVVFSWGKGGAGWGREAVGVWGDEGVNNFQVTF